MKTSINPLATTALLALAIAAAPALASGPASTGALPTKANRIVGLWGVEATVRPCSNPAAAPRVVRNTLLFHAGGTVTENPGGLPTVVGVGRSFGLGTWAYDPESGRYGGMLRFDSYLNGVYSGYQTVDRDLGLQGDDAGAGAVVVTAFNASGVELVQLCGTFVQTRL